MSQQVVKGSKSSEDNKQADDGRARQNQIAKRNRHSQRTGSSQYTEVVRVFLRPEKILLSHRVSFMTFQ